ncbi:MAG: CPBP family intramembrane metalloprotease [Lewinellaceae bacterium]|nr:CPBP family intramembrane metalloprotease [Saprospiraceae bacterium]MCB9344702.1 CPBP family intramembrane metalloprotease [Lewinellaceae bacterium]
MKAIFINPNTHILRAGWLILSFVAIFIPINFGLTFGVHEILGSLKGGGPLWFTLLGISATLAVYLTHKYLNKESFVTLGLRLDKTALLDVVSGVINSGLVMAGIYFTMLFTGLIEFSGFSCWSGGLGPTANFSISVMPVVLMVLWKLIIVAWWEELVWRGVILQYLIKGVGLIWAVVISSALFGLIHAGNPDATVLSTLLIALITPQLIYAYLKTGQLWLPIGLHLGWNFFQASVFGFASSGNVSPSLIMQKPLAADWLSGGSFGAEGSIIMIPFTIASFFLIHWWVGQTRAPGQGFWGMIGR